MAHSNNHGYTQLPSFYTATPSPYTTTPSPYTTPTATTYSFAQVTPYVDAITQIIVTPCGLLTNSSLYARERLSSAVYATYVPCWETPTPTTVSTKVEVMSALSSTKHVESTPPTVVAGHVSTDEQRVAIAMVDMATPIYTFDPLKGAR